MIQSERAKPVRSIWLASLMSTLLGSNFGGFFLAHSMHVVTPGSASSRVGAIGLPHRLQVFVGREFFFDIVIAPQFVVRRSLFVDALELPHEAG